MLEAVSDNPLSSSSPSLLTFGLAGRDEGPFQERAVPDAANSNQGLKNAAVTRPAALTKAADVVVIAGLIGAIYLNRDKAFKIYESVNKLMEDVLNYLPRKPRIAVRSECHLLRPEPQPGHGYGWPPVAWSGPESEPPGSLGHSPGRPGLARPGASGPNSQFSLSYHTLVNMMSDV
eukprot:566379-Hanusia_phi.AAC.1